MVSRISAIRASALLLLLPFVTAVGGPVNRAKSSPEVEVEYHSMVPLGMETFAVRPWHSTLTVMALAENPEFEGWRRLSGTERKLVTTDGQAVEFYPAQVTFRVTATTEDKPADAQPAFPMATRVPENDYLLKLRFRLKIFHGLQTSIVEPTHVDMIGVPADVQADERIYRMSFDLQRVPMDDRVVLEVLSPDGGRLCKFHLDLN